MNSGLWLAKLAIIFFVLLYFKIFNLANFSIYLGSVLALAVLFPERISMLPEIMLAASTLMFTAYLFIYGCITHLNSFRHATYEIEPERIVHNYVNPFLYAFIISLIFSMLAVNAWAILLLSFLIMPAMQAGSKMYSGISPSQNRQIYAAVCITAILVSILIGKEYALVRALRMSLLYTALLSVYYLIKSTFTIPYKIDMLKPGMLPAETIVKISGRYERRAAFFSLYAAIQAKSFRNPQVREIITPFEPLTAQAIKDLKNGLGNGRGTGSGIDEIIVQKTIDFRIFLLSGFAASYIVLKVL